VQVSPTEAVMDITAYDPNMRAAVVGDYVVVTKRDAAAYPAQAQPSPGVPLLPPTDPDAIMGSARGRLDQGEPAGPEGPPVWHQFSATLGVKGFVGFAGKDVPAGADAAQKAALATEDGRAGLGWMVGPTLELRGFRFLAFETGYLHSSSTLKKDTFFTGGNVKQEVTSSGGRVPLLLKLVLPSDSVHAWLGGGIDFWFGKDSELKLKGGTLVEPSTDPPVPVAIGSVEPADQTFWILDLGFAYVVESIVLSIEVRAYYNPDIDANWKDYFKNQVEAGEHTIDAGLMLGLGYELDVLELLEQP
jgi:hypothetical protein